MGFPIVKVTGGVKGIDCIGAYEYNYLSELFLIYLYLFDLFQTILKWTFR